MSELTRLDHHLLSHLIAKANGRETISLADNHLAEVLLSEMDAADVDVLWGGPTPDRYPVSVRAAIKPAPRSEDAAPLDVERLARAMRAISLIPSLYRGPVAAWVPTAEALAREYAALAPTDPER